MADMMSEDRQWRLAIHGGAGIIARESMSTAEEGSLRNGLAAALAAGSAILEQGGAALDAVEEACRVLEDDANFNAGRGSVFTFDGTIEMDAAIMDGRERNAGAVTGATATKNPIRLARAVMEHSPHVLISGDGADLFSREQGLEQAPRDYFETEIRRRALEEMRARPGDSFDITLKYGTVGAVALDSAGHVAAATSTGGITGKRWGRIGDSPIIGAGTWADDRSCAVSATGAGEYFLRAAFAHEISACLRCASGKGGPPRGPEAQAIVDKVVADVGELGGTGGAIVVTAWGDALFGFNTEGMYRGRASPAGHEIGIFAGDTGEVPAR